MTEEVLLRLSERQIALICIVCTERLVMLYVNTRKGPLTLQKDITLAADLAEIVERLNMAMGQEPSIELRKQIEELRRKGP